MLLNQVLKRFRPGTVIPKPRAKCQLKGEGRRRGERAIIYTIPNHNSPERHTRKELRNRNWPPHGSN